MAGGPYFRVLRVGFKLKGLLPRSFLTRVGRVRRTCTAPVSEWYTHTTTFELSFIILETDVLRYVLYILCKILLLNTFVSM